MDGEHGPEGIPGFATQAEAMACYEAGGKGFQELEAQTRTYVGKLCDVDPKKINEHFSARVGIIINAINS